MRGSVKKRGYRGTTGTREPQKGGRGSRKACEERTENAQRMAVSGRETIGGFAKILAIACVREGKENGVGRCEKSVG